MNAATPLNRGAQPEPADDEQRAPVASPGPGAARVAGIVVLSADSELRDMLGGISGALAKITLVDDWAALLDALASRSCGIVLLDAERVEPAQLDSRLGELHRLPVPPVIVAASGRERAKEFMDALAAGQVHRLLLKPATPGGLRLVLDYAIARSRQQRPQSVPQAAAPTGPQHRRGALLVAGMGIVFAVTVLGALSWRSPPPVAPVEELPAPAPAPVVRAPAPEVQLIEVPIIEPIAVEPEVVEPEVVEPDFVEPEATVVQPAPAPREIDVLLERGEARLQAGDLLGPQDENAFSYYLRAAAIEGSDPGVTSLRARLGEAIVVATLQALDAGDVPESWALLDAGDVLGINAVVLDDLAARVDALHAKQLAEQQAAHEAGLLAAGLERLRLQQLIVPERDSAVFYLARLRAENPDHPELAAPWAALLSTLAENARDATATAEFALAEASVDGLRRLDADATLIESLSAELAIARRQHEFLQVPAPQSELQLLHFEPASYPRQALLRNIEGWADVEFIVDRDGLPRDIEVTAAEPPGIFERSAVNAVGRYRYEPFMLDGYTYERRVALRLLFTLD